MIAGSTGRRGGEADNARRGKTKQGTAAQGSDGCKVLDGHGDGDELLETHPTTETPLARRILSWRPSAMAEQPKGKTDCGARERNWG